MAPFPTLIVVVDEHSSRLFVRRKAQTALVELIDYADTADLRDHHDPAPSALVRTAGRTRFKPRAQRTREELEIFTHHVAAQVDQAMDVEQGASLAIVAPPLVLGYVRDFLSARTRDKLACESSNDLVKHTLGEVDAAMRGLNL